MDNKPLGTTPDDPEYYTTDAFTDYAMRFCVREQQDDKPFFL